MDNSTAWEQFYINFSAWEFPDQMYSVHLNPEPTWGIYSNINKTSNT